MSLHYFSNPQTIASLCEEIGVDLPRLWTFFSEDQGYQLIQIHIKNGKLDTHRCIRLLMPCIYSAHKAQI